MAKVIVNIVPHPASHVHVLVKIYYRGRVFATTWAEPYPTEKEVMEVWGDKARRQLTFLPFDESYNRFIL